MHDVTINERTRKRLFRRRVTEWRAEACDGATFLASPWAREYEDAVAAKEIMDAALLTAVVRRLSKGKIMRYEYYKGRHGLVESSDHVRQVEG